MKPIRIAALVVVGAAVVALAGVGRPDLAGGASEPSGGITVTGTGTVQTTPDQAAVHRSASRPAGRPPATALAANSRTDAPRARSALRRRSRQGGCADAGRLASRRRIRTKTATRPATRSRSRSASSRRPARSSTPRRMPAPTTSTARRSPAPNEAEQQAKALRAAVDNARAKARVLAEAAGVQLGRVTAITESGSEPAPVLPVALALRARDSRRRSSPAGSRSRLRFA